MKKLSIILLLCAGSCGGKLNEHATKSIDEKSFGGMMLRELSSEPVDFDQFTGKVVFVNVWATWCGPCVKEMPSIERAKQKLDGEKIEFLFASNESKETIEEFAEENQLDIHFVRLENFEEMNLSALPTTLIFDSNGELAYSESGFRQWDDSASVQLISRIASAR